MWFSVKRTTMRLTEAATLDRKSGEAEGPAVRLHPSPISNGKPSSFLKIPS
jgi:hypothetical protein